MMQSLDNYPVFFRIETEVTVSEFNEGWTKDQMLGRQSQEPTQIFSRIVQKEEETVEIKEKKGRFDKWLPQNLFKKKK